MYLPYGRYTANNVPFSIKRNAVEIPEVSLFLHIIKSEEPQGGNAMLYTGLGVTGAAVIGLGAYLFLKPETKTVGQVSVSFDQ